MPDAADVHGLQVRLEDQEARLQFSRFGHEEAWHLGSRLVELARDRGFPVYGLFNSVAAFVPGLIEQGGPSSVVVTASMAGLVASPTSGAYAASKAAAVAYTKALASELATSAPDVAVVLLCPGMVATNLMRSSAAHSAAQLDADLVEVSHGVLNDLGATPADVAQWVFHALAERRLWAVPPAADPFTSVLVAELSELLAELATGDDGDG